MTMTLDEVAAVALGLPETAEVLAWEQERTFRTRNKIFVMGADGYPTISVKTSVEEQRELVATDPDTFSPAPYVGRFGWTRVVLSRVDPDELAELIVEAWRRTATKKAVTAYDTRAGGEKARDGVAAGGAGVTPTDIKPDGPAGALRPRRTHRTTTEA